MQQQRQERRKYGHKRRNPTTGRKHNTDKQITDISSEIYAAARMVNISQRHFYYYSGAYNLAIKTLINIPAAVRIRIILSIVKAFFDILKDSLAISRESSASCRE